MLFVLAISQITLAIVNLIFGMVEGFSEDYSKANWHLLWGVLMILIFYEIGYSWLE